MKVLDMIVGKKMKVMTDAKVEVELVIERAELKHHSRDLAPATAANDWWPPSQSWTTVEVKFTNGHVASYSNIEGIDVYD